MRSSASLIVDGPVEPLRRRTTAEVSQFPRGEKAIEFIRGSGWRVKAVWSGLPLWRLIDDVVPLASASTVISRVADGYTTSLVLATILERGFIVADKISGITWPQERGFPLQLAARTSLVTRGQSGLPASSCRTIRRIAARGSVAAPRLTPPSRTALRRSGTPFLPRPGEAPRARMSRLTVRSHHRQDSQCAR